MSSMKELARLMKELEDQLVACMRCGLCQAVCPLFAETGREADVARGKLALLSGLAAGNPPKPPGGPGSSEPLPVVRLLRRQLPQRRQGSGYLYQGPGHPGRLHGTLTPEKSPLPGSPQQAGLVQPHHGLGRQIPGDFRQAGGRPPGLIVRPLHVAALVRPAL